MNMIAWTQLSGVAGQSYSKFLMTASYAPPYEPDAGPRSASRVDINLGRRVEQPKAARGIRKAA